MYPHSGLGSVEESGARAQHKVQLEFNPACSKQVPVIVHVHRGNEGSGVVQSGRQLPEAVTAAEERNRLKLQRKVLEAERVREFRRATKLRVKAWKEMLSEKDEDDDDSDEGAEARVATESKLVEITGDLRESKHEELQRDSRESDNLSLKARKRMLRFTEGRRSFRMVPGSPGKTTVATPSSNYRNGRKERKSLLDESIHSSNGTDTSFRNLESLQSKEKLAKHQASVRKKQAAFDRLLARRRRAVLEHHRKTRQEQSILKEVRRKQDEEEEKKKKRLEIEAEEGKLEEEALSAKVARASTKKKREREESLRYIAALQRRLEDMAMSSRGITLPALCSCSKPSPKRVSSSAPWEKCANNCRFYKNPQAYAQELSDLFKSLQL